MLDRLEKFGIGPGRGPIEAATEEFVDGLIDLGPNLRPLAAAVVRAAAILDSGSELRSQAALMKEWRAAMTELEKAHGAAGDDGDGDELDDEVDNILQFVPGQSAG